MNLPQMQRSQRSARVRPAEFTSAILRLQGGSCTKGDLEIISLTGGLLSLPKPLIQGARVTLMFLTQSGPVLGVAEMLKPQSWKEQAFRFVELHEADQRRLRAAIQPSVKAGTLESKSTPAAVEPAPAPLESHRALDHEQQWIEKYRAAIAADQAPKRHLLRTFLGHLHRRQSP
jgi:hypothetical protein